MSTSSGTSELVTLVTAGAESADLLTEQDYREIFEELRSQYKTLRAFADTIGSKMSFGWWGKYENGKAHLDRERKAELRAAVGLPVLPPTVAEATAVADPNALVWQVGAGRPDRVVLVGEEAHEPVTLRLNGWLEVVEIKNDELRIRAGQEPGQGCGVTGVTSARRRAERGSIVVQRGLWERLNLRRLERGVSWEEFLGEMLGTAEARA